ncbi:cellulose binding domain-containing protein [Dactylosporangium sp. CA-233914]|uniref:cellulose binding domain-containing protein n=1 Tax=Dactylosporangium sp. CA-233914 TaxID=3239934 RepID=UPI003D8A4370
MSAGLASTCAVRYWFRGAEVWVGVRNIAPATVNGWTLSWVMPTSQPVLAIWNAALVSQTGGIVIVRDLGWDAELVSPKTMCPPR